MFHRKKFKTTSMAFVMFATSLGSLPLYAQEDLENAEEIAVVGTRSSKMRSVTDAPVPIDIVDKDELAAMGGDADAVESLTALIPSLSANPQYGDGSATVRAVNMRGMPSDRSLVLVNGKRRHRSALMHTGIVAPDNQGAHAPDIGHIPTIALKNIEVLRDGAAAQYGSDAIAGVVNLNLDDANSGKTVSIGYGQHFEGESNWKIAANVGAKMCDDGYLNLSAETNHMEHLSRGTQNLRAQALIDAGVDGVGADSLNADGYVQTWGRPEQKGTRLVANMGCFLSDSTKVYSFANYGHADSLWSFFYRFPRAEWVTEQVSGFTGYGDLGGDGGHAAFSGPYIGNAKNLNRERRAGFTPRLDVNQQDYNVVMGMKGSGLMGFNVDYDISASRGYNKIDYTLENSLNPTLPIGVLCDHDANADTDEIGCLGADGSNPLHAVRDFDTTDIRQRETNFNLDLTQSLSANTFLAYGLEYRQEEFTQYPGGFPARYGGGVSGMAGTKVSDSGVYTQDSYAAYADMEYDMNENLLIQGAGRFESSDAGSSITGKLAARMNMSDTMALRGAFSTGFKAPTVGQANYQTTATSFAQNGSEIRTRRVSPTSEVAMAVGGAELENETSTNLSVGMTARFMRDMNLTADFYLINLNNRISTTSIQGPNLGDIEQYLSFFTNAMDTQHMGFDVVLSHRIMNNTTLTLAYNYNTISVEERREVNGNEVISDAWVNAVEKARPEHRLALTGHSTMMGDKLGLMARVRYYGAHYDTDEPGTYLDASEYPEDTPAEDRLLHAEIESTFFLDLELTYNLSKDCSWSQEA